MIRGYKLLIKMVETSIEDAKRGNESVIKEIAHTFHKFNLKYPDYFKAIMEYGNRELGFINRIDDKSKEECYALGEKLFSYLISALKNGMEEDVIRKELDVENTAIVLWACTLGIFNSFNKG